MTWLSENWFWVLIAVLFVGMHMFGHGHGGCGGGHGGHGTPDGKDSDKSPRHLH